jgi:hypothetical protein
MTRHGSTVSDCVPGSGWRVSTPRRRALSPCDQRNHLFAERGTDQIGVLVAVCEHVMPWSVDTCAPNGPEGGC